MGAVLVLPQLNLEIREQEASYVETIFDKSRVTTVDITLSEKDLENILANPMKEEVVSADVVINGEKVENVGFRTKGNMTLRSVAQMDDSDRYSFKIDFDKYVDEQSLHGLKKINLNNNYTDPTQQREYLSYDLMEKMDVPTPANSYMYVTINGKEWGLYLGVEAIEETFLDRNFLYSKGDLYKPDGVGSDLKWISDDIDEYKDLNLKTNKKTSDETAIINMLDAINNGGTIEEFLNVDEMLRYFATNTALVNLDSYQGQLKHNYYLYEENGVFSILPWDYNMSFAGFGTGGGGGVGNPGDPGNQGNPGNQGGIPGDRKEQNNASTKKERAAGEMKAPGGGGNPAGDMAANFMNEENINFSITTPVGGVSLEDRPLLQVLLSVDEYREKYNSYLKEIATTYFTEEHMQKMTTEASAVIRSYVEKDPTKFYTLEQFDAGVSGDKSLVAFSIKRAESIVAQLSGELVVEANTTGAGSGENQGMPEGPGGQGGPEGPGERPQGMAQEIPPDMAQGQMPGNMQMNDGNGQGNRMAPPSDWRGRGQTANEGYSQEMVVMTAIGLGLMGAAILFTVFFKRRRG